MIKRLLTFVKSIADLDTIEEKSFWIVAPAIFLAGLAACTTGGSYASLIPAISVVTLCFLVPSVLIFLVLKFQNYHWAYPVLCITCGAVTVPFVFISSGGFLSGTALCCVITTSLTVLCYSPRWRYASFLICILGNTAAFFYVYRNGVLSPIIGTESLYSQPAAIHPLYNDIIFSYYVCSVAMFFVINFIVTDIRRYKINQDTLQKYFDKEKRNEILKSTLSNAKSNNSEHQRAAIIFADITNFTTITESLPSEYILQFLNEFFTCAEQCIHSTNGIIDKYIGDCVMAYWLEETDENCVLDATTAMINLKQMITAKEEAIYQKYHTELNFSVGIGYGDVILGDFGSESMHDFTIIGDAVNVANRLESSAAGGEILIAGNAARMVQKEVAMEEAASDYFLKGKNMPIDFYRVTGFTSDGQSLQSITAGGNDYTLTVCGCRGSIPVSGLRYAEYGGETSCYVVRKDDYAVIVDCGTGLRNADKVLADCRQIDILLTHVHYDHILGFLMAKFPADAKIRIFGHFSEWNGEGNTLEAFMNRPYWPVGIRQYESTTIETGQAYPLERDITATFYPSDHPDDACVISLDCGGRKVVFLFDCEQADSLPEEISADSELLFFDGMYDDNDPIDHTGWGHGTWQDAVRFMQGRSIKKLVITHHDPMLGDHSLMMRELDARENNPNISFAKSGDIFLV